MFIYAIAKAVCDIIQFKNGGRYLHGDWWLAWVLIKNNDLDIWPQLKCLGIKRQLLFYMNHITHA